MISLIDAANAHLVDWWLVFRNLPPGRPRTWWYWFLSPGFEHVEAWHLDRGAWIRTDPSLEFMPIEVHLDPPWDMIDSLYKPTFLRVTRLVPAGKVREPFMFGPVTCVELVKAVIGVRAPFVRTPFQLFEYLKRTKQ